MVADEVRNLAHRAQESAQQIQKMIEELQIGAQEAVSTMTESQRYSLESVEIANRAGERLSSVTGRIAEIDGMNQSVATATEEQTAVVDSLNMDITEINTLNQEGVESLGGHVPLIRWAFAGRRSGRKRLSRQDAQGVGGALDDVERYLQRRRVILHAHECGHIGPVLGTYSVAKLTGGAANSVGRTVVLEHQGHDKYHVDAVHLHRCGPQEPAGKGDAWFLLHPKHPACQAASVRMSGARRCCRPSPARTSKR